MPRSALASGGSDGLSLKSRAFLISGCYFWGVRLFIVQYKLARQKETGTHSQTMLWRVIRGKVCRREPRSQRASLFTPLVVPTAASGLRGRERKVGKGSRQSRSITSGIAGFRVQGLGFRGLGVQGV